MVEIEYLPYQKIIVHEARRADIADLLAFVASQIEAQKAGGIGTINWVDGVAFVIAEFLPSPETISESLKGRVHYAAVTFSETSFQSEKKVTLNNRDYTIRLMKGENNPNFVALAKFLKSFNRSD